MTDSRNPLLYQLNTRVYLRELSTHLGRAATLDDVPDELLDWLAAQGFDWLYLLGVWQTGLAALHMSLTHPGLNEEYRHSLPDFRTEDVCGSCFAITGYSVHNALGGAEALQRLRRRLAQRNIRLMLDFISNHTAPDHPWVQTHPEYYIQGHPLDLESQPLNYTQIESRGRSRVFAYGRDPYFPGWADTLQLDYSNPQTVAAMQTELLRAAAHCDGLRCDMAMLVLPDVFERTWGRPAHPFWPAAIRQVKAAFPGFVFMAEVYWDLEAALLDVGFDYTYDKRLYDYLRDGQVQAARTHLRAEPAYLEHMVHFLENHDEQRAASVFTPEMHRAAAVATFFVPGMRFFHQGQLEGRKVRISVHLQRGPHEPVDPELNAFYQELLAALRQPIFTAGAWQLLKSVDAATGLPHPALLAYGWSRSGGEQAVVVVNYTPQPSRGLVQLPWRASGTWLPTVTVGGPAVTALPVGNQLEVDLPPWGAWVAAHTA